MSSVEKIHNRATSRHRD